MFAVARIRSYGSGNGLIWLDNVVCVGNESTLLECDHAPLGISNCRHNEDIGIMCNQYQG